MYRKHRNDTEVLNTLTRHPNRYPARMRNEQLVTSFYFVPKWFDRLLLSNGLLSNSS